MSQNAKLNSVQIAWLNTLRKAGRPVTIFLCTGARLSPAVVTAFDLNTVQIRIGKEVQLVSKTNIASVVHESYSKAEPKKRVESPSVENPTTAPAQTPIVTVKRRRLTSADGCMPLAPI